jgi:hypothetical protein
MGPPARPGAVLTGFSEPTRDRPGFELYLRNNLEEPVKVTSITLYECENVKGGCFQWDPELTLEPGEAKRIKVVEPALRNRGFTYRWRWTYRRMGGSGPGS